MRRLIEGNRFELDLIRIRLNNLHRKKTIKLLLNAEKKTYENERNKRQPGTYLIFNLCTLKALK